MARSAVTSINLVRRLLKVAIAGFVALIVAVGSTAVPADAQSADTDTGASPTTTTTAPARSVGSTLSVAPAILDYAADPGTSFTAPITILNGTITPVAVQGSAQGYVPEGKLDPAYKSAYDASPWFELDTPSFLLLPQQSKVVNVTISIPKDAEPGGHYATVYFESFTPDQAANAGSTSVNGRLGVIVLLTVKGTINQQIEALGPVRSGGTQLEAGPTSFHVTFANRGNVHVVPQGKLVIRDLFGRKVKSLPLPQGILLPGVEREYEITWNHGLNVGRYSASAEVIYDINKEPVKAGAAHTVLFPLVLIIPSIIVIVLVIWLALTPRRRRRRRARARTKALLQLAGEKRKEREEQNRAEDEHDQNQEGESEKGDEKGTEAGPNRD